MFPHPLDQVALLQPARGLLQLLGDLILRVRLGRVKSGTINGIIRKYVANLGSIVIKV